MTGTRSAQLPMATQNQRMLCVVMPALNEEATIGDVISKVPRTIEGISDVVVLVVDDGSTDNTRAISMEAGAEVVSHPSNRGLGAAFRTGVAAALAMGADFMVNIDADGQFDPADIPKVLQPLTDGNADCVTASRFADQSLTPQMYSVKLYGNHMMSWLISKLVGRKFFDVSCGFRAYTADTLCHMNLQGRFTYTQETFMDLIFKGMRIVEVPLSVRGTRPVGESRIASSIPRYAYNTSKIIFRTIRDYYPLRVFTMIASSFLIGSAACFIFLLVHYLQTGSFSPHKWAGFAGSFLGTIGVVVAAAGLLADMFVRIRVNQEQILYMMKRDMYRNKPDGL